MSARRRLGYTGTSYRLAHVIDEHLPDDYDGTMARARCGTFVFLYKQGTAEQAITRSRCSRCFRDAPGGT